MYVRVCRVLSSALSCINVNNPADNLCHQASHGLESGRIPPPECRRRQTERALRLSSSVDISKKFDVPKLRADVEREYYAYPTDQLEKMWAHKEYIMDQVVKSDGGNTYERHKKKGL